MDSLEDSPGSLSNMVALGSDRENISPCGAFKGLWVQVWGTCPLDFPDCSQCMSLITCQKMGSSLQTLLHILSSFFSQKGLSKSDCILGQPLAAAPKLRNPEKHRVPPTAASLSTCRFHPPDFRRVPFGPSHHLGLIRPTFRQPGRSAIAEDFATSATPVNRIFIWKDARASTFSIV